jgi:hypothetical protein
MVRPGSHQMLVLALIEKMPSADIVTARVWSALKSVLNFAESGRLTTQCRLSATSVSLSGGIAAIQHCSGVSNFEGIRFQTPFVTRCAERTTLSPTWTRRGEVLVVNATVCGDSKMKTNSGIWSQPVSAESNTIRNAKLAKDKCILQRLTKSTHLI